MDKLNIISGLLTVTVGKSSYAIEIGQTVTLDCSWSGIPPAYYITWQKVINGIGRDINVRNGKYVGSTVSSPSLIITAANNDDEADYICTATNAVGRNYSERTSLDATGSKSLIIYNPECFPEISRGHRGRDRMIVKWTKWGGRWKSTKYFTEDYKSGVN